LSEFFSPADGFHSEKLGKLLKHERSSTGGAPGVGRRNLNFVAGKNLFLLVFPCEIHLSLTSQKRVGKTFGQFPEGHFQLSELGRLQKNGTRNGIFLIYKAIDGCTEL
jgi:hypothetical protein